MSLYSAPFWPQFGAGAPGVTVPTNQLYFNTVASPYLSYVFNPSTGLWVLFGDGGSGGPFLPLAGGTMTGPIVMPNGTAATPSFVWTTGGWYDTGTGLNFAVGGAAVYRMTNVGALVLGDVTATAGNSFVSMNYTTGINVTIVGGSGAQVRCISEGPSANSVERYTTNAAGAAYRVRKSRGTIVTPTLPVLNDVSGTYNFEWNAAPSPAVFSIGAQIGGTLIETGAVASTAIGTRITFNACPIGSGTLSEMVRMETATGISMGGANPVIDANRVFRMRSFTVGTLPAGVQGGRCYVTDANATLTAGIGTVVAAGGANVVPVFYDGANWRIG